MKYTLVILFAIMAFAKGQIIGEGNCTDISKFNNLNKEKILGTWFTTRANNEMGGICMKDVLESWEGNALLCKTYGATNTSEMEMVPCRAELQDKSEGTKFVVQLRGSYISSECIDTDYDNYLISTSCGDSDDKSQRTVWISTRSKTPSKEVLDKISASLKKSKLDSVPFHNIPQTC